VAERPLVRLPLQVGTTATWAIARAAVAAAPGLGLIVLGIWSLIAFESGEVAVAIGATGGLLVFYAGYYVLHGLDTRASDLLVFRDRLRVEGGSDHGLEVAWSAVYEPWAGVSDGHSSRLVLWKVPLTAIALVGGEGVDPYAKLPIWRLWVRFDGKEHILAESDRPEEARSLRAAAATIAAIAAGKRHTETSPQLGTEHANCSSCNAPLLPDDAAQVECRYCHQIVELPAKFRERAAGVKSMEGARSKMKRRIEALLEQPGATRSNLWLLVLSLVMFAAWPIGWGVLAQHTLANGFHLIDLPYLAAPLAAVLGGFLFARARLADRRAMQLLTLGYGALAPEREGEPSKCRRCLGPLPDAGLGAVSTCRYCGSDSIVGIDLRPVIDKARAEDASFERALKTRRRERLLWAGLTVVALAVLAGWAYATIHYKNQGRVMQHAADPHVRQ
jgi:hypothetical protein